MALSRAYFIARKIHTFEPDPLTVRMYRLNAEDAIVAEEDVAWVRKRPVKKDEKRTSEAPSKSKTTTFVFFPYVMTWVLREGDYFNNSGEWWHIQSLSEELQGTRTQATCVKSKALV
jgi:hypothetical protein